MFGGSRVFQKILPVLWFHRVPKCVHGMHVVHVVPQVNGEPLISSLMSHQWRAALQLREGEDMDMQGFLIRDPKPLKERRASGPFEPQTPLNLAK